MTASAPNPGLTAQQQAALAPKIRLIEAGPGAGKTKTVVTRLRQQAAAGKRVALLSFTNAAVDVARSRCRDAPNLLEPPNFIGTFDQFFHRYVTTPATRRTTGKSPTYLSSWDDLLLHRRTIRPKNGGAGFRLTLFERQHDGSWAINEARMSRPERLAWDKLTDWTKNQLNIDGHDSITALHNALVYDTDEARRQALDVLNDPDSNCLPRLARRFDEIIVDEFQDCDRTEHHLLGRLKSAGIHIVVVADPDQAIYEFRQSSTGFYENFRRTLKPDEIANLTICFRSTPAICSLVTSLRSVGTNDITADPNHTGGSPHVHLVIGANLKAGKAALEIVRKQGFSAAETRVIAHRRADARALVRAGNQPPRGTSQMENLLTAIADLRSGTDARGRLHAVRKIEVLLLSQFAWNTHAAGGMDATTSPADADLSRSEQLDALQLEPAQLRVAVANLLAESPSWTDAKACSSSVRQTIEAFAATRSVDLIPQIGQRLKIPPKVWEFWLSRTTGTLVDEPIQRIRWGHVHSVKGEEFDAVILAISSRTSGTAHVLDDWQHNQNTEQRRVLYVGASRARKLLVLVIPKKHQSQVQTILAGAHVDYTITSIS